MRNLVCCAALLLAAGLPALAAVPPDHAVFIPDPSDSVAGPDGRFYGELENRAYYLTRAGTLRVFSRFPYSPKAPAYRTGGSGAQGLLGVGPDGAIYGATRWGGAFDRGVIYKMDASGRRTALKHFLSDGSTSAVYVSRDGTVYASRLDGEIERIRPDGTATTLPLEAGPYEYAETPQGDLLLSALSHGYAQPYISQLYRLNAADEWELLAELGRSSALEIPHNLIAQADGSVLLLTSKLLKVAPDGEVTVLHEFALPFQGQSPVRMFQAQDGSLIGHTYGGGLENAGVVFRVVPETQEYTVLKHLHARGWAGFNATYVKEILPLRLQATSGNRPPCAKNDVIPADRLRALAEIHVLKNDTDADGDPLTIVAVGTAAHGKAAFDFLKQQITYTPASEQPEYDAFSYTIADGNGGTAQGRVVIQPSRTGRYQGELRGTTNPQTGEPGALAGTLDARVNARGVVAGRLHLLEHDVSFSGQFNDFNVFGTEVLRDERKGSYLGIELRLQPAGHGWEIAVVATKNWQPYTGTCHVPPPTTAP